MTEQRLLDLQPWPLAMAAFRRAWQERDDVLRLAAIPAIVTFLAYLWFQRSTAAFAGAIQAGQEPDAEAVTSLQQPLMLYALVNWCFIVLFSVNWMRVLILGSASVPGLGLTLGRRHLRLLIISIAMQVASGILMGLLLVLVAAVMPAFAPILAAATVFLIWCLLVIVRLGPAWVGIAIDAPMKFRDAWHRTQGAGVRLAIAIVLVSFLPFALQIVFLQIALSLGVTELAPMAISFVSVVIQYIMVAGIGAVFVLSYPRFVSETV